MVFVCETEGRNSPNQKCASLMQASAPAPHKLMCTTSFAPRRTMIWFLLGHTSKTPPSYALPLTLQQVTMTTWGVGTQRAALWPLPAQRVASSTLTLMTSALAAVAPTVTQAWATQERGTWAEAVWVTQGTESFMTGVLDAAQQRVSTMGAVSIRTMDCMMALSEEGVTCMTLK